MVRVRVRVRVRSKVVLRNVVVVKRENQRWIYPLSKIGGGERKRRYTDTTIEKLPFNFFFKIKGHFQHKRQLFQTKKDFCHPRKRPFKIRDNVFI